VNLNVRVIDRNNRPIGNVRQDEFIVYENGVPQPIFSFSKEEVPVSYGLAIDTSGSLRSQLAQVIEAGKVIINSNKPGDETFLVRFISSDKIEQVLDFTSNTEDLIDSLDTFYTEGGQTAIVDAVYVSAEHVAQYKKGDADDRRRRALIVVTDGEDRGSQYKQEELFERLREEDVQIYVIGFVNELDREGGLFAKARARRPSISSTAWPKKPEAAPSFPNPWRSCRGLPTRLCATCARSTSSATARRTRRATARIVPSASRLRMLRARTSASL
jgi:VWFA-related protein